MITFILAAAVLVGALCVAVALDDATTEAPPGVVARLLVTDQTVPVAWGVRLNTDRGRNSMPRSPQQASGGSVKFSSRTPRSPNMNWLARRLAAEGIGFTLADNAFARIDDWQRAQELADAFSPDRLHRVLDRYAGQCCPVLEVFGQTYHWSLMQVEYATDLVFRSVATLGPLDEQLTRQSVLSVKAEQIATFLGRQITPQLAQELGSQFSTRIEGTCIKHRFGDASIKMYDKFGQILRIETTTNDVSFFKHHRKVEHRQGPPTRERAPVKKSIYSLIDLREILFSCNRRYLAHLSALDDFSVGVRALDRLTKPRWVKDKTVKGINFFDPVDNALLHALQDPRVNIAGIRRADLMPLLDDISPPRLSRQLRRMRDIGVIKRVAGTYRYYLTRLGRSATAALCHLIQSVLIPALI